MVFEIIDGMGSFSIAHQQHPTAFGNYTHYHNVRANDPPPVCRTDHSARTHVENGSPERRGF